MSQQLYSQQDVQQIIQRAATLQEEHQMSEQQLEQITAELGISAGALQEAKQQWLADQDWGTSWARLVWSRQAVQGHAWGYLAVSGLLGLDVYYSELNPRLWLLPLLWGAGVLWHWRETMRLGRWLRTGKSQSSHPSQPLLASPVAKGRVRS